MFVRKNKIAKTKNIAIQVVEKVGRKNKLIKHIGTAKTPLEVNQLTDKAREFIDSVRIDSGIISFFDSRYTESQLQRLLQGLLFLTAYETVTYQFLEYFYQKIGFNFLEDNCFKDLVIARIVEPCSKRRTKELLEVKFGKHYSLTKIYRTLFSTIQNQYKSSIEQIAYQFILKHISCDISVLFFDVSTLYYEAFDEDDFRKCGFSKDHKHNQPQIVIGLTVTRYGMPLSLEVFEGSTFEGHTMFPSIKKLCQNYQSKEFIVVADSGMMSQNNLEKLEEEKLKYIVGARLANIGKTIFEKITSKIKREDGYTIRIKLAEEKALIVSYSSKRATKDKHDREKQIKKARQMMKTPSTISRRYKYLKTNKEKSKYQLNQKLIEKSEKLEGLKGYVTNALNLSNKEIVIKYSELWQVENAFRISKSDLKARPIFHTKKESIEAHILIVFTALVISRYIEIVSRVRINRVVQILSQIKEVVVQDPTTNETAKKLTNLTNEAKSLLSLTDLAWVT